MVEIHLLYALAWAMFGLLHSLLARQSVKTYLKPLFSAFYRLAYNIFAAVQLAALYAWGSWLYQGQEAFMRPDLLIAIQWGLYALGWALMMVALFQYDLGTLSGLKQIRDHMRNLMVHDEEPLHFQGLHCWVRHPLYCAGFLILWGRIDSSFDLMTALFASIYLWVGSIFEERHMIRLYGDHYATYKSRVPAFIPYKGKVTLREPSL